METPFYPETDFTLDQDFSQTYHSPLEELDSLQQRFDKLKTRFMKFLHFYDRDRKKLDVSITFDVYCQFCDCNHSYTIAIHSGGKHFSRLFRCRNNANNKLGILELTNNRVDLAHYNPDKTKP